jgi:diguanylate cyclase (GGDEF)-like protein
MLDSRAGGRLRTASKGDMVQPDEQGQGEGDGWIKPVTTIDATTGLLNAHGWVAFAKRHLKRAVYSQQRLGLVLLRVQNFARLKTDLGQDITEAGIQQIAEELQALVRPGDLLGRWRDDDFIVLLPYVDAGAMDLIAERLAHGIRKKPILVGNQLLALTIVTGGASLVVTRGELHELDALISEGERRLTSAVERC